MNTTPETQIVSVPDGSIRDYVDGKVRKDTPEEYVRQTIENRVCKIFDAQQIKGRLCSIDC